MKYKNGIIISREKRMLMIKMRNLNKTILAYVMAFIISLTSLPAALAEGEVELTNDDAIETTIPDESKEEIGFSERKDDLWSQGDPSLNLTASNLSFVTWGLDF